MLSVVLICVSCFLAYAQGGFGDDRVMLQGFYWESYRHGHPERSEFQKFGNKKWYEIVADLAPKIREARFDLVWLPPPSYAGAYSAGYNPKEYFNLNNAYGNFDQHRFMLEMLLGNGIEPIADIVINHRDGKDGTWGTWAICKNDEAFTDPRSEVYNTPVEKRGADEEQPVEYASQTGTAYGYGAFRDIDHTNKTVRRDLTRYLMQLKSIGYRGWRYDMVHGYHAKRVLQYNRASRPTFSVGEYDWDKQGEQRGWVWYTATTSGELKTSSNVFDFSTKSTLQGNKRNSVGLYGFGNGIGLVGDDTDGLEWKNRAVTFLENHDTGHRTNEDGTAETDHKTDSFLNGMEVEQGYAYILTHPGIPCVYWKHYFDWGPDLQYKIRTLINARKVAGVNAGSKVSYQNNAKDRGVYAAMIEGSNGQLYVRVGGDDNNWEPYFSNYRDYREYAHGDGWKVWVSLPGNPDLRQAPLKDAFPIPQYQEPNTISIADELVN